VAFADASVIRSAWLPSETIAALKVRDPASAAVNV